MKKKIIIFAHFFLIIFSCVDKEKNNKMTKTKKEIIIETINPQEMNIDSLRENIIKNKDITSFKYYYINQRGKSFQEDHIKLSEIIFNEYESDIALYFLIISYFKKYNTDFQISIKSNEKYFKNIPNEDLKILLNYINLGVVKQDLTCIQILSDYYKYEGDYEQARELEKSLENIIIKNRKKVNDSLRNKE